MTEGNNNRLLREAGVSAELQFPELRRGAGHGIRPQEDIRNTFYGRDRVPIYYGQARFVDPHTITVGEEKEAQERLTANNFVIAVGSRPYRPHDVDFNHPRIFDSDTILNLSFTPWSVTIYGAGVVGC